MFDLFQHHSNVFVCFSGLFCHFSSLERDPNRTLFVHVPAISDAFTADYLGDFLLLLIIILCKNCDIPISSPLADYLCKC